MHPKFLTRIHHPHAGRRCVRRRRQPKHQHTTQASPMEPKESAAEVAARQALDEEHKARTILKVKGTLGIMGEARTHAMQQKYL